MNVGSNIRRCREEANMSQEELASRLCTSRQTIYNWENGYTSPDAVSLDKLATALGCQVQSFFAEGLGEDEAVNNNDNNTSNNEESANNIKEGIYGAFDKGAKTVIKHWRKIYMAFFAWGAGALGMGTLMAIVINIFIGFGKKEIIRSAQDQNLGQYSSLIESAGFPAGSLQGNTLTEAEQSQLDMLNMFGTIAAVIYGTVIVTGIVLIIVGFVLLQKDKKYQKELKENA